MLQRQNQHVEACSVTLPIDEIHSDRTHSDLVLVCVARLPKRPDRQPLGSRCPDRVASSERQFCERLQYDLLFKWFLGLNITDQAFDPTTFTHNRKRLLKREVAEAFLEATVRQAKKQRLISEEHFTVDGVWILSSRHGRRSRAFARRMKRTRLGAADGTPRQTFTGNGGATRRTARRPTPRPA